MGWQRLGARSMGEYEEAAECATDGKGSHGDSEVERGFVLCGHSCRCDADGTCQKRWSQPSRRSRREMNPAVTRSSEDYGCLPTEGSFVVNTPCQACVGSHHRPRALPLACPAGRRGDCRPTAIRGREYTAGRGFQTICLKFAGSVSGSSDSSWPPWVLRCATLGIGSAGELVVILLENRRCCNQKMNGAVSRAPGLARWVIKDVGSGL